MAGRPPSETKEEEAPNAALHPGLPHQQTACFASSARAKCTGDTPAEPDNQDVKPPGTVRAASAGEDEAAGSSATAAESSAFARGVSTCAIAPMAGARARRAAVRQREAASAPNRRCLATGARTSAASRNGAFCGGPAAAAAAAAARAEFHAANTDATVPILFTTRPASCPAAPAIIARSDATTVRTDAKATCGGAGSGVAFGRLDCLHGRF
mmetsp:Transcript_56723/g.130256  ORF Transcript_56723/g.130256 Transcript_56723/m.130256 type:complete len:212 (+) Transcript_56723:245-880(+)